MRAASASFAASLLFLTSACTLIVSNQFKDTDGYDAAAPEVAPDPCSITGNQDAGDPTCANCITTNCSKDVAYACNAAAGKNQSKPWFQYLQQCAEQPNAHSYSWGCDHYDDPDAQAPNTQLDDPGYERRSEICVYQHCLAQPVPACRQCLFTTDLPGSSGGTASLDDSACGQCIRSKCGALLVSCCRQLPSDLAKCGYPSDPTYAMACHALGGNDNDGSAPQMSDGPSYCAYQLATQCMPQCASQCP